MTGYPSLRISQCSETRDASLGPICVALYRLALS